MGQEAWWFDLGQRTGVAHGPPTAPKSFAVVLKHRDEPFDVAYANLIALLDDLWRPNPPALVGCAVPMRLGAFMANNTSQAAAESAYGLAGILRGMSGRFGLRTVMVAEATVRKYFVGKGRMGSREATKAETVARAQLLGLLPRDKPDEDRADALAGHDWLCATHFRRSVSTETLHLWGERPR